MLFGLSALCVRDLPSSRRGRLVAVLPWLLVVIAQLSSARAADPRATVKLLDRSGQLTHAWLPELLFEERDAALVGSRVMVWLRFVKAPEFPRFPEVLDRGYSGLETRLRGTPVTATLLGLQRPERSTTVVIEPDQPSKVGFIFLHGFGGNFALQCQVLAHGLPALTLCPSVGIDGAWWTDGGEQTVRAAITALRARGAERIVLAGLSNGAAGASLLAPRLRGSIDGLILISGIAPQAGAPGVPTLMLQGDRDGMMRTAAVRQWATTHANPHLRFVELPGTHFLLLEQPAAVQQHLRAFVANLHRG